MKWGAAGLAGWASGTWRPGILRAQEAFIPYILHVHCDGGWDPTMVFDPKIGKGLIAQEDGAGTATAQGISYVSHPDRPAVDEFFGTYGANTVLVNGLSAQGITHERTLYLALGAVPEGQSRPVDWLTFYTAHLNPVLNMPHVVINAPYMPGEYASTTVRLTTPLIAEYTGNLAGGDLGSAGEEALKAFLRYQNERVLDEAAKGSLDSEKLRAISAGYARESTIRANLTKIVNALGDQGEDSDFVRHGKMAVEMFANGYSQAVSVQCGKDLAWDTARDHFASQSVLFEDLFSGLSAIFSHAASRQVLSRMLVMVTSERGRAPRLNAEEGKSPWTYTSAMIYGPGILGGQTVGSTDDALRGVPIHPFSGQALGSGDVLITMRHVVAALYLKFGVPYKVIMGKDVDPLTPILTAET